MRARWRVSGERAIVGESLAGLFIVETFLLEPGLFQRYIALSPSVWWNGGELCAPRGRARGGAGRAGGCCFSRPQMRNRSPAGLRRSRGAFCVPPPALTLYYEPRPDLEHGTIFRVLVAAFVRTLW